MTAIIAMDMLEKPLTLPILLALYTILMATIIALVVARYMLPSVDAGRRRINRASAAKRPVLESSVHEAPVEPVSVPPNHADEALRRSPSGSWAGSISKALRPPTPIRHAQSRPSAPATPSRSEGGSPYRKRIRAVKHQRRSRHGGEGAETSTSTSWYEAEEVGEDLIGAPPDLTGESDLEQGDLFYHRTPTDYQLWMWTTAEDGRLFWQSVYDGFARHDGRRLTLTKAQKLPSWVSNEWFNRRLGHALLYILMRLRKPRARAATVAFCYSAAAVLKPHRTTNLEFFAPSPPNGHFDNKPTILREFVENDTSWVLVVIGNPPAIPRQQRKPAPAHPPRTPHRALVITRCASKAPDQQPDSLPSVVSDSASSPIQCDSPVRENVEFSQSDINPSPTSREESLVTALPRVVVVRPGREGEHAPNGVKTAYFQMKGTTPIAHPPVLTSEDGLEIGDVFHVLNVLNWKHSQLWIWDLGDEAVPFWKPIKLGYRRQDGRRLTLTEKRRNPSWVADNWFTRRNGVFARSPRAYPSLLNHHPAFHLFYLLSSLSSATRAMASQTKSDGLDAPLTYTPVHHGTDDAHQASHQGGESVGRTSGVVGDDFESHLEDEYAEALRELQDLSSCNASMFKAVLSVQRLLKGINVRLVGVEEEIVTVRQQCDQNCGPAKLSYRQAQGGLKKERNALETFRTRWEDKMETLQLRLQKIEATANLLKAVTDREEKGRSSLEEVLSSIQVWAEEISLRVERLEDESTATKATLSVLHQQQDIQASYVLPYASNLLDEVHSETCGSSPSFEALPAPPTVSSVSSSPSSRSVQSSPIPSSLSAGSVEWAPSISLADEMTLDSGSSLGETPSSTNEHRVEVPTTDGEGFGDKGQEMDSVLPYEPAPSPTDPCGDKMRMPDTSDQKKAFSEFLQIVSVLIFVQYMAHGLESMRSNAYDRSSSLMAEVPQRRIGRIARNVICMALYLNGVDCLRTLSAGVYKGEEKRGRLFVRAKTVADHAAVDQVRKRGIVERNEARISSTILLAAVTPPGGPSASLPVRSRDLEDADSSARESVTDVLRVQATMTATPSSPDPSDPSATSSSAPSQSSPSSSAISPARARILEERLRQLGLIESLLHAQRVRIPLELQLRFRSAPSALSDPAPELADSGEDNSRYVSIRSMLLEQSQQLKRLIPLGDKDLDHRRKVLLDKADAHLKLLEQRKDAAWEREVVNVLLAGMSGLKGPVVVSSDNLPGAAARSLEPWLLAGLVMSAVLHSLAAVSRPDLTYVLATIQAIIYGAFMYCNGASSTTLDADQAGMLAAIPSDVRTVLGRLGLEPDIVRYASCPKCHATYTPDKKNKKKPYPPVCSLKETDKGPCGEPLVCPREDGEDGDEARKYYPYHSLLSWIAALSLRPELLRLARSAWTSNNGSSRWRDIWDAPILRQFLGPDGRTPYSAQPEGSVHLVFSLFIDWFNPFGNKKAGKQHSIGGIYLVCLNLPPHLRYRPENVYLAGIIPGPKEPELHELNHYLRPLVDELLTLWHRGLYVGRSSFNSSGWLIRAAVVPLVCDLPALRKTAGFASHSAKRFCSFCLLLKPNISNLDRSSWPRRSREDHYNIARRWRDADSDAERGRLFDKYGIRWSELLRLPYWDPTRFSLLDAMHNLFLGELKHHCRALWGIDDKAPSKQNIALHSPEEQSEWLHRVAAGVKKGSKMKRIRRGYVAAMAEFNGAIPTSTNLTKEKCVQALLKWWGNGRTSDIKIPPVLPEPTADFHLKKDGHESARSSVLDYSVLAEIRADIAQTRLPSWLERPPRNFGSGAHGKLKADHWRTICTVNMVITLVRIWSSHDATEEQQSMLENFVHLVCAVDLATRRSVDAGRIAKFDNHMRLYLEGVLHLFPWHKLVPNHHYSLHLPECLFNFGPVHAWWSFPFERFNGILQRLNHNSKSNTIPITFMRYFYLGTNLRWLMATTRWPTAAPFKNMVSAFNNAFRDVARGTRLADARPLNAMSAVSEGYDYNENSAVELSQEVYQALLLRIRKASRSSFTTLFAPLSDRRPRLSNRAQYVTSIKHNGLVYGTDGRHARNSYILYSTDHDVSDPSIPRTFPRAGQIKNIFLHVRAEQGQQVVEPFFLVSEYKSLSEKHAAVDPYRRFADLETRLFYNKAEGSDKLITLSDIQAHFAAYVYCPEGIGEECIVVRSLDRRVTGWGALPGRAVVQGKTWSSGDYAYVQSDEVARGDVWLGEATWNVVWLGPAKRGDGLSSRAPSRAVRGVAKRGAERGGTGPCVAIWLRGS
ncbi:hypothetical protein ACG7TL_001515 [Trametes sanguinea]